MSDIVSAPATQERAARAVDEIAWADLVALVHRQMRSIVGPSRDLEDLAQSALEQVVRALERFEGRAELSTFTYRICAHVALSHWRWYRRWLRRFELGLATDAEPADEGADAPERLLEQRRATRLHAALERLDGAKRLVLVLSDMQDLPASEIATILECPEPTVRSRLRQARLDLAKLLARDPHFQAEGRTA